MKALTVILSSVAALILFQSFKKSATNNTNNGNQQNDEKIFKEAVEGVTIEDLIAEVSTIPPTEGNALPLPKVSMEKIPANTNVRAISELNGNYCIVFSDYKRAYVPKLKIKLFTPAVIINNPAANNNNPTVNNNNAGVIIDEIISATKPPTQPTELPSDELKSYEPALFGKVVHNTAIIRNGYNVWISSGSSVSVLGYKKHYAFNSKGELVFTEHYNVKFKEEIGYVPMATIEITNEPFVSANVENFTVTSKYDPAVVSKTNKNAEAYGMDAGKVVIPAGSTVIINRKGVIRTNRIGNEWKSFDVYTGNYNGVTYFILVADIIM